MNERTFNLIMSQMMTDLSLGMTCLPEKEMARLEPLPMEVHHTSRDLRRLSCLETLQFTKKSLDKWLKAGMEENRFGLPFVKISRMILDAVTTMGRGLVTLHMLGEDLSQAPMSIGELLDIASFHFIKSSEGVQVSAGKNMTVCTRLFANQLRWQNLILRLYRTQERLQKLYQEKLPAEKKTVFSPDGGLVPAAPEPSAGALSAACAMSPLPAFEQDLIPDVLPGGPNGSAVSVPSAGLDSDPLRADPGAEAQDCLAAGEPEPEMPSAEKVQAIVRQELPDESALRVDTGRLDEMLWELIRRGGLYEMEPELMTFENDTS